MEATEGAGSHDVSNSKPVVPRTEQSKDLTGESNENVNEADKDDTNKDNFDWTNVASDAEGGKNKQGTMCCVWLSLRPSDFLMQARKTRREGEGEQLYVVRRIDHDAHQQITTLHVSLGG